MNKKFMLTAGIFLILFVADLFVPDPIPVLDEAVLAVLTVLLGYIGLKRR